MLYKDGYFTIKCYISISTHTCRLLIILLDWPVKMQSSEILPEVCGAAASVYFICRTRWNWQFARQQDFKY